jgi:hypothetical protein
VQATGREIRVTSKSGQAALARAAQPEVSVAFRLSVIAAQRPDERAHAMQREPGPDRYRL